MFSISEITKIEVKMKTDSLKNCSSETIPDAALIPLLNWSTRLFFFKLEWIKKGKIYTAVSSERRPWTYADSIASNVYIRNHEMSKQ